MGWGETAAAVLAVFAGVSVTLQLGGTIALNEDYASDAPGLRMLESAYVTQGGLLVGAAWLAVLAVAVPGRPMQRPQRCWSCFGGVATLPAFVTTPAAQVLGLQFVLQLLVLGMVGAALVFDYRARRLRLGRVRGAGLALLCAGVAVEVVAAAPLVRGPALEVAVYVAGCLAVGALFAVQSKMNKRLARDLGSSLRSAAWSNSSALAFGVLGLLYVRFSLRVEYNLRLSQWWIWLLVGLQSAFYTLSMTLLPKKLAYSTIFVLVLAGKLGSSTLADTLGAFRPPIPLTALRCVSVCTMFCGAVLYTYLGPPIVRPAHQEDFQGTHTHAEAATPLHCGSVDEKTLAQSLSLAKTELQASDSQSTPDDNA